MKLRVKMSADILNAFFFSPWNILCSQDLEVDVEGRLSLHQLTNLLEDVVEEQSGLPKAVVNIYKHEIVHLK